jgi:GcrA cell cycle regulator
VSAAHRPDRIDAEIIRRRLAGETYAAIADALDLTERQLWNRLQRLRALGCKAVAPMRGGRGNGDNGGRKWPEARRAQLRVLWNEGHSTAEIGRRLGVTKNMVVGEAHRMHLLARPSPIRRGRPALGETNAAYLARIAQAALRSNNQGPRAPLPPTAATLPPLASLAPVAAPSTDHGWRFEPLHQKPGAGGVPSARLLSPVAPRAPASGLGQPATAATKGAAPATGGVTTGRVVTPPAAPLPARYGRVTPCAWPLDDWRRPGRLVSCDAPSLPGKPYCGEHCRRAYQRAGAEAPAAAMVSA